jgi:hypothetical protein
MLGQSAVPRSYSLCAVMFVPSVGMSVVVGTPVAPYLARGLPSLERGRSMPRGSGALVLTLQGSSETEIVPGRA